MALSEDARNRIGIALADFVAGGEVADAIDGPGQTHFIAGAIVATSASATTNFKTLLVKDLVLEIDGKTGAVSFSTVATAGTLPAAATIGNLYVVLRPRT
ncbi:hypothetical protein [Myxococcus phage Mx1]|nr:hypothetical protein [Myxococcus phage Mx1]